MSSSLILYSRCAKALTALIALAGVLSIALLIWGSNKGFDLTDEGLYLLYYTYPKDYSQSFSGFHLLLAPLGSVVTLNVVNLRLIRLGLLFSANVLFAAAFVYWLGRSFRTSPILSQFKPLAFSLLVLGMVMPYTWLAQTPGYNDLAAVFGLAAGSCVLIAVTLQQAVQPSPGLTHSTIAVAGFFLALLGFVKWTSAFGLGCLVGATLCVALPNRSFASRALVLGSLLAGILAGLLCLHLLCIDLVMHVKNLAAQTALVAQRSPAGELLVRYWHELYGAFATLVRQFWWGFLLLLFLPEIFYGPSRRRFPLATWLLLAAIFGGLLRLEKEARFLRGASYMPTSIPAYFLLIGVAATCWAACRWNGHRLRHAPSCPSPGVWNALRQAAATVPPCLSGKNRLSTPQGTVGLFLFLLPFAVAAGTAGHLFSPALYLLSAWNAVLLIFCLLAGSYRLGRIVGLPLSLLAAILMVAQFLYGYSHRPYRLTTSLFQQTTKVPGLPRGSDLFFDKPTADFLSQVSQLYQAASPIDRQPIVALYDLPGLVYLLGGISPGAVWYSDEVGWRNVRSLPTPDKSLTATNQSHSIPFLLLPPQLSEDALEVLRSRLNYPQDYRLAGSVRRPRTDALSPTDSEVISLWIPKRE